MIKKKICMLGDFAVGKTSLVSRFVSNTFSPDYLTTIGVRVEKKDMDIDGTGTSLLVWDMNGDDRYQRVRTSYIKGSAGFAAVIDGTRPESLQCAAQLKDEVYSEIGPIPFVVFLNKNDISNQWKLQPENVADKLPDAVAIIRTSAKTGDAVNEGFSTLARETLKTPGNENAS